MIRIAMGVFRTLYDAIRPHRFGGKTIVFAIDVLLFGGVMIATTLVRKFAFGSISLGADIVAGFAMGFTAFVAFNAVVYFGSLFSKSLDAKPVE